MPRYAGYSVGKDVDIAGLHSYLQSSVDKLKSQVPEMEAQVSRGELSPDTLASHKAYLAEQSGRLDTMSQIKQARDTYRATARRRVPSEAPTTGIYPGSPEGQATTAKANKEVPTTGLFPGSTASQLATQGIKLPSILAPSSDEEEDEGPFWTPERKQVAIAGATAAGAAGAAITRDLRAKARAAREAGGQIPVSEEVAFASGVDTPESYAKGMAALKATPGAPELAAAGPAPGSQYKTVKDPVTGISRVEIPKLEIPKVEIPKVVVPGHEGPFKPASIERYEPTKVEAAAPVEAEAPAKAAEAAPTPRVPELEAAGPAIGSQYKITRDERTGISRVEIPKVEIPGVTVPGHEGPFRPSSIERYEPPAKKTLSDLKAKVEAKKPVEVAAPPAPKELDPTLKKYVEAPGSTPQAIHDFAADLHRQGKFEEAQNLLTHAENVGKKFVEGPIEKGLAAVQQAAKATPGVVSRAAASAGRKFKKAGGKALAKAAEGKLAE